MRKQLNKVMTSLVVSVLLFGSLKAEATFTMSPPRPIDYARCNAIADATEKQRCLQQETSRYEQEKAIYDQNYAAYQQQQQQYQQQQQQYQQTQQSASDAAKAAQKQMQKSSTLTKVIGGVAGALSAVYMVKFVASCTPVGCANWPALGQSIFYGVSSAQAFTSSSKFNRKAWDTCLAANNLSSSTSSCGPQPPQFSPSNYPYNVNTALDDTFDGDGRCIAAPELCREIEDGLVPSVGPNIKAIKQQLSSFALKDLPYKFNPDGSLTLKNGKVVSASAFESEESMKQAGFTPEQIKAIKSGQADFGNLAKALDPKEELSKLAGVGANGEFGEGLFTGMDGGLKTTADGTGNGDGKEGERSIASAEGLMKDFNGELIGVAGDDIWKMMNRRYRLKETQDSFMGPVP